MERCVVYKNGEGLPQGATIESGLLWGKKWISFCVLFLEEISENLINLLGHQIPSTKRQKHLTIDHIHIMLNWWNLVLNKIVSKRKLLKSHISSTELPFYVAFHFASGYFLSLSSSMSSVFRVVGGYISRGFKIWAVFDVGRKKVFILNFCWYVWPVTHESPLMTRSFGRRVSILEQFVEVVLVSYWLYCKWHRGSPLLTGSGWRAVKKESDFDMERHWRLTPGCWILPL